MIDINIIIKGRYYRIVFYEHKSMIIITDHEYSYRSMGNLKIVGS